MNEINDKIYKYAKKNLFDTWQLAKIDVLVNSIVQKISRLKSKHFFSVFLVRCESERIESIHLQKVQASVVESEKEDLLSFTQLGKEEILIILLSA